VRTRALRRLLRERDDQLRALSTVGVDARDEAPPQLVVERQVRLLSEPLRRCFTDPARRVRLPADPGAQLLLAATGGVLGVEVSGVREHGRRACIERVLQGLRVPPFAKPEVRGYVISLSWLGLDATVDP
jgi:hypothetical protein